MIESVAGEGLAVVESLHDSEDVVVVVPIDRRDQCNRTQVEVVDAELVVMAMAMAMAMERMEGGCYGVDER